LNIIRVIFITLVIALQAMTPVHAFISNAWAMERIEVVIIHSYHADYPWTHSQNEAFISTLKSKFPNYQLDFSAEYLDTKRIIATPEYFDHFAKFINNKHSGDMPRLIYVTDDYALHFITQYKGDFLDNAPIVFSGINNLSLNGKLDRERYTGVFEVKELKPNLELVERLFPDTHKVIFVGDDGVTSHAIDKQVQGVLEKYPQFEPLFITSRSLSEISKELKKHHDGVVLLTTIGGVIDQEGHTSNLDGVLKTIVGSGHIVMTMEDDYLKNGVIGGYVTSGRRQGEAAALLSEKIINGVPVNQIEPLIKGSNEYLFDAQALEKHGIKLNFGRYENVRVVNEAPSLIDQYHEEFDLFLKLMGLIFVLIVISFVLITQRKNRKIEQFAREALDSSALSNEYKRAFDITNIVSKTDLTGKITYVNDAFVECFGYSREELLGNTHAMLRDSETSQELYSDLWTTILAGNIWRGLIKNRNKEGDAVYLDASVIPIKSESGEIQEFIATRIDITERVHADAAMKEARDLAEAATEAKSQFLANMSHEIRTPMNAILGMGHLALQTELTEAQHNYINKGNKAAKSLLNLINDILDFSKIEAGKLNLELLPFHLEDVLNNLSNVVSTNQHAKRVEILFDTSQDIPYELVGDSLRLTQVLINLLNNAIKFTEEGEIIVSSRMLSKKDKSVVLEFSVKDSGIGIEPDKIENLFDIFSQVDSSTTRKYGGSGLGLAICKELVEIMGGNIRVTSRPQQGSTFTFTVRLDYEDKEGRKLETIPDIDGMRALVIDDSQIAREIIRQICRSLKIEVDLVESGSVAIERIKQSMSDEQPYQLLLVDWLMPSMDGVETLRRIKQLYGSMKESPLAIMMTSYNLDGLIEKTSELMLDGYLVKPITPSMLLDKLMFVIGTQGHSEWTVEADETLTERFKKLHGSKVLVVEDNPVNLEVTIDLLQQVGVMIGIANNGQEGVDAVKQGDYDAVLMDIHMPIMDGYEATRTIRNESQFKDLPIIALTANAMSGDSERSLGAGCNEHLNKPIDPSELYSTLEHWLGLESKESSDAVLEESVIQAEKISSQKSHSFPEIEGVNVDLAIDKIGGRVEFYRKLLGIFLDTHANDVEQFHELTGSHRYEEAVRLAHSLKSSAGNIGATTLQKLALDLEMAFEDNPEEASVHQLPPVISELDIVIPALREGISKIDA